VEITLADGTRRMAGRDVPHGHHDDPMTDAEVREKFAMLAGRKLAPARAAHALDLIWNFERCARIDDLFDAFALEEAAAGPGSRLERDGMIHPAPAVETRFRKRRQCNPPNAQISSRIGIGTPSSHSRRYRPIAKHSLRLVKPVRSVGPVVEAAS